MSTDREVLIKATASMGANIENYNPYNALWEITIHVQFQQICCFYASCFAQLTLWQQFTFRNAKSLIIMQFTYGELLPKSVPFYRLFAFYKTGHFAKYL